jgi:hypothetical protein
VRLITVSIGLSSHYNILCFLSTEDERLWMPSKEVEVGRKGRLAVANEMIRRLVLSLQGDR